MPRPRKGDRVLGPYTQKDGAFAVVVWIYGERTSRKFETKHAACLFKAQKEREIGLLPSRNKNPIVYFVQAGEGLIKIGYTGDFEKRFDILRTGSPYRLKVLLTLGGKHEHEQALHNIFWLARAHGEWFYPIRALVNAIAHLKAGGALEEVLQTEDLAQWHGKRAHVVQAAAAESVDDA